MKKRFELLIEESWLEAIDSEIKGINEKTNIKMSRAEYIRQILEKIVPGIANIHNVTEDVTEGVVATHMDVTEDVTEDSSEMPIWKYDIEKRLKEGKIDKVQYDSVKSMRKEYLKFKDDGSKWDELEIVIQDSREFKEIYKWDPLEKKELGEMPI